MFALTGKKRINQLRMYTKNEISFGVICNYLKNVFSLKELVNRYIILFFIFMVYILLDKKILRIYPLKRLNGRVQTMNHHLKGEWVGLGYCNVHFNRLF
jgi:hypothetical protein